MRSPSSILAKQPVKLREEYVPGKQKQIIAKVALVDVSEALRYRKDNQ